VIPHIIGCRLEVEGQGNRHTPLLMCSNNLKNLLCRAEVLTMEKFPTDFVAL